MRLVFALLVLGGVAFAQEQPTRKEWPVRGLDEAALRYTVTRGTELEQRRKQLEADEKSFHELVMETMAEIAASMSLTPAEARRLTFGPSLQDSRKTVFFLVPADVASGAVTKGP